MTIRLLVEGRGPLRRKILDKLTERAKGRIELVLHFGDRDADFHSACLQRMEVRRGRKGHLMEHHLARGAQIPLLASPDFHKLLEISIEQFQRSASAYRYRSHNLQGIQDYLDYYHILADAYAQQIQESGATHALFMNVPHLGADMVLYQVATALKLKTLVISQTVFDDSFFSMERVEDFGRMSAEGAVGKPMPIEKGSAPDLFFMDAKWQQQGPRGKLTVRAVVSLLKHLALHSPSKLLNPAYIYQTLKRIHNIYGTLPLWRDPFAEFFHVNEMAYFEHMAQYSNQPVDWNAKFVYIPLHNQPEMSTQSLGGLFRDQVLMVEAIASVLPEDWRIYVKDNPRQGAYARGPMYFHRLTRIKGVQLMPLDTSTYELSTRAQLTATVSGTAGWEALRKGKPAVVFGAAWYRSFPGVFQWQEGMDLEAISKFTFPHEDIEQAAGNLVARCHPGIIELIYEQRAKDLNQEANVDQVSLTLDELLSGQRATTFMRGT